MRLTFIAIVLTLFVAAPVMAQTDSTADQVTQEIGQAGEDAAVAADDLADTAGQQVDEVSQEVSDDATAAANEVTETAEQAASEGETLLDNVGTSISDAAAEHHQAAEETINSWTWEQGVGLGTGILAGALIADLLGGGGLVTLGASAIGGWLGYTVLSP